MPRTGFGKKDGSQRGWKQGGGGRNRTSECRHPKIKKERWNSNVRNVSMNGFTKGRKNLQINIMFLLHVLYVNQM